MLSNMKGADLRQDEDIQDFYVRNGDQEDNGFKKSQVYIPPLDFSKLKSFSSVSVPQQQNKQQPAKQATK